MKMVESCLGKNFIIHCEKNMLELEEKRDHVFCLHSTKVVNCNYFFNIENEKIL